MNMIEIYKAKKEGEFVPLRTPQAGSWINIVFPTKQDFAYLKSYFEVPPRILASLADIDELPTIEKLKGGGLFILVKTPKKKRKKAEREERIRLSDLSEPEMNYFTVPLGIIITQKYLITISYFKDDIVGLLRKRKNFLPSQKIRTTLRILFYSAKFYLKYLKEIHSKIYRIQKRLERSTKNKELIRLLNVEKSLVYFRTALSSNFNLIERLTRDNVFTRYEADREILDDVIEDTRQAIEVTEIYSDILSGMMDAFASIINNNLNLVMRFLTTITIILMIPTLVASFYGMNIELPFQHSPYAFLYTMIASIAGVALAVILFRRKEFF